MGPRCIYNLSTIHDDCGLSSAVLCAYNHGNITASLAMVYFMGGELAVKVLLEKKKQYLLINGKIR